MRLRQHLISALSLAVITLNLVFWLPAVLLLALLKVVSRGHLTAFCHCWTAAIYRQAVRIDSWWLRDVLHMRLVVEGTWPRTAEQLVVIANHASWFDILILQDLLSRDGPMLRFLVKRQLVWVPIVGWICVALGFPTLTRRRGGSDRQTIEAEMTRFDASPQALLVFPEGTRLTTRKRHADTNGYRRLLTPRTGAFTTVLGGTSPATPVLDVTLAYPASPPSFWECLSGSVRTIRIKVDCHEARTVSDPAAWLRARWRAKDRWLGTA